MKKCEGIAAMLPFLLAVPGRVSAEPARGFDTNAELHAGVASAPFFTKDYPEAKGRGGALFFGGSWHAENGLGVGLTVPLVLVRITEPENRYTDEPAWGNPLFSFEGRLSFARGPQGRVDGLLRLGVGAPLADFGPPTTLSKSRALAIADAIDGWQNRELFAPGVLPFTVTTVVTFERGVFRGEGTVKLAAMPRINDADLPDGAARAFAFSALAALRGTIWPFTPPGTSQRRPELGFGALASLLIDVVPQASVPGGQTLQFVMAPLMSFRVGQGVQLGTEFLIPVGGSLGGNTYGLGFDATIEW